MRRKELEVADYNKVTEILKSCQSFVFVSKHYG